MEEVTFTSREFPHKNYVIRDTSLYLDDITILRGVTLYNRNNLIYILISIARFCRELILIVDFNIPKYRSMTNPVFDVNNVRVGRVRRESERRSSRFVLGEPFSKE